MATRTAKREIDQCDGGLAARSQERMSRAFQFGDPDANSNVVGVPYRPYV